MWVIIKSGVLAFGVLIMRCRSILWSGTTDTSSALAQVLSKLFELLGWGCLLVFGHCKARTALQSRRSLAHEYLQADRQDLKQEAVLAYTGPNKKLQLDEITTSVVQIQVPLLGQWFWPLLSARYQPNSSKPKTATLVPPFSGPAQVLGRQWRHWRCHCNARHLDLTHDTGDHPNSSRSVSRCLNLISNKTAQLPPLYCFSSMVNSIALGLKLQLKVIFPELTPPRCSLSSALKPMNLYRAQPDTDWRQKPVHRARGLTCAAAFECASD